MGKKKCICCGEDNRKLIIIFKRGTDNGYEEDYSGKFICKECLEESNEYGICELCDDDAAYHIKDLREHGSSLYCREHYTEVIPSDDDEEEDWDSFGEYMLDPSHWS
jgi:hypothetical protein